MAASNEVDALRAWFGDPSIVGATSWLEAVSLAAGAIAVVVAIYQLRRNALQARAAFLLQLDDKWDRLEEPRQEARVMRDRVREEVIRDHARKKDAEQEKELRVAYKAYLRDLRTNDTEAFVRLSEYWGFYETLGLMVRKGYLPMRDAYLLYKGPLIEIDRACRAYIQDWEKEAHIAPGLYENMLRLASRARRRARIREGLASLKFWGN